MKKYNFSQEKVIIALLFSFSFIEVLAELCSFKAIMFAFRPLVALLLIYLYWVTSKERNVFFLVEQAIKKTNVPKNIKYLIVVVFKAKRFVL